MARRWCSVAFALVAVGCGDTQRDAPAAPPHVATKTAAPRSTTVTISGSVIDRATGTSVGPVDVILRGELGDTRTTTSTTGNFTVKVERGRYRMFVVSDTLLSTGFVERVRLDNMPRRELARVADEELMPMLDATDNYTGIELGVTAAAILEGFVRDPDDKPVFNAIVRARQLDGGATRPIAGTDIAVTDGTGHFVIKAPAGRYLVDASYPLFAGAKGESEIMLDAGKTKSFNLSLARGCIVSGRVVNADGSPANDGAIEKLGPRQGAFGPAGRIEAGTFWWSTIDDETVTLRAWPWHSPPSPAKTFDCKDGKRFTDVVLRLPEQRPDMSGFVVDTHDRPVPLAYLDVQPLDRTFAGGQQERGDAAGSWHVYDMPPARYRVTGSAPGLGIVDTVVVSPRQDVRLQLGGIGRIVGTTPLVTGSVEVSFLFCGPKDLPLVVAHEPRIVPIVGGRFTIERAPACTLTMAVRWRDNLYDTTVVVDPDRTAYLDLDIGAAREKTVTGVVRDRKGNAVGGARVTAVYRDHDTATVRTDARGRYTIQTQAGAQLTAGKGEHAGRAYVGRANVAREIVDVVLDDAGF